jgi:hypothetical protein
MKAISTLAEGRGGMRRWWPLAAAVLLGLVLWLGGRALLANEAVRGWMYGVTGEEDAWEGAKGVVALTLLDLGGDDLELAPLAVEAHASVRPVGVNTFLQLEPDPAVVRRSFELMRDAGVGWARQHFPWEDIEIHGQGDYEDRRNDPPRSAWDKYDRIVQLSEDYDVQLLGRLDDPPAWAYDDPDSEGPQKGPPSRLTDWASFVGEVVGRYCGRVRYWQLWNEPNIYPEWGERDVDPRGYVDLLAVGATAAREACSDVVIVSAALAQTTEAGGRNMDDLAYLQALYDAEWAPHFDVLAAQAFGLWTGPTDRRVSRDRANFPRLLLTRDVMVRAGDAHKAIWITEFGWNSVPDTLDAPYGRVDEATRAEYTREAYERIADEWPFVGAAFLWYLRRPTFEWHERPEGWFRLVDPDWTEAPSMAALREVGLRPPVLRRGRHEVSAPGISYSGVWRAVPPPDVGAARARVGSKGAEAQITFRGTGYRLVRVGSGSGDSSDEGVAGAEVTASDGVTGTVSATAALSTTLFVVLDGESETFVLDSAQDVVAADGLDDDFHTLILRVDGGELALDEVVIEAPEPGNPLGPVYALLAVVTLGFLAAVAGAVWIWRGRGRPVAQDELESQPSPSTQGTEAPQRARDTQQAEEADADRGAE